VTASWTYSYTFLDASNSLAPTALTNRGFAFRMVQTDGPTLGNSLARAEAQLGTPPAYTIDRSFEGLVYKQYWNNDNATPNDVPGLDGVPGAAVPLDNIATEALGYMRLTAGAHRFRAVSDDGFKVLSGSSPTNVAAQILGFRDGGTFTGSFDFIVEADGLYPTRIVWYENGGGAVFFLTSVNPCTLAETAINDPSDPAGVVKAYVWFIPTVLQSSATADGPYANSRRCGTQHVDEDGDRADLWSYAVLPDKRAHCRNHPDHHDCGQLRRDHVSLS